MKWFLDTFLTSLETKYFERGGKMWLTKKQTDVCRRYMDFSPLARGLYVITANGLEYYAQTMANGSARFFIMRDGWEIAAR